MIGHCHYAPLKQKDQLFNEPKSTTHILVQDGEIASQTRKRKPPYAMTLGVPTSTPIVGTNIKVRCSLRHLKATIRNRNQPPKNLNQNQTFPLEQVIKEERTTTIASKKYVFRRPRKRHLATSSHQQLSQNKTQHKSIRQYLHEINDTPTKAYTICEIYCFDKDTYKVTDAFVDTFSMLELQSATKIIATNDLVCRRCVYAILDANIPDYAAPWNISRNKPNHVI